MVTVEEGPGPWMVTVEPWSWSGGADDERVVTVELTTVMVMVELVSGHSGGRERVPTMELPVVTVELASDTWSQWRWRITTTNEKYLSAC